MSENQDCIRAIFEKQGKLFPCPNPVHFFKLGRLTGGWQWAETYWSTLSADGSLRTDFVRFGISEKVGGEKLYGIVIYKLSITFGFVSKIAEG
jgi:hypothetical protein